MRLAPLIICLGLLAITSAARGQTLLITVGGMFDAPVAGMFSGVPTGTPFTFTQTFNVANAVLVTSDATDATYLDPTGSSSITFDNYTYSGNAPEFEITSGFVGNFPGAVPIYADEFFQVLPNNGAFAVALSSTDSSVAPDTSLSHLHAFTTDSNNQSLVNLAGGSISGNSTSLSIRAAAAPEPSSILLSILAVLAFVKLRFWQRANRSS